MSATSARTLLFARIAHRGVTARSARLVPGRASASPRCRGDRVGPIVLGPPPATAPRAAASGSRAFGPAYAPRGGSGPVSSTPSLRRRVAGLRVVVSASGDVQDTAAAETTANAGTRDGQKVKGSHQLLTFFCFTQVPDYEKELEDHRAFIAENNLELRGRIYINQQGINAQMSGRGTDGEKYARWVESREHFNGMRISVYPVDEQAHPKLSLRYKPQLVQLEGGTAHLPVHDPKRRGTPLSPEEWHAKMSDVLDEKPDAPLLLDVRNGYEWDVGHFRGAQRPVQESFRETVETNVAGSGSATDPNGSNKGPLAGVDKSKPIMMYCTGGIRCDVYSTVLKEQGYENVFTLEGGVQAYFDAFGNKEDQKWDDQLFVFDSRLAMTPTGLPAAEAGDAAATLECYCCGERKARAPHRNCPNVDCNRLFLVCQGCLTSRGGFCCAECGKASHVRPTLLQPGRYQRYVHYTEGEAMLRSERRGDGRRERRRRRRERKKLEHAAKDASLVAAGQKPRDLLRAVRVLEKAAANPDAFAKNGDSGTLAARTRSIVKAAGLLDDDAASATTNPVEAYATQREKLREAAEAIAAGKTPGVDLRAFVESAEAMVESSADEEREKRSA